MQHDRPRANGKSEPALAHPHNPAPSLKPRGGHCQCGEKEVNRHLPPSPTLGRSPLAHADGPAADKPHYYYSLFMVRTFVRNRIFPLVTLPEGDSRELIDRGRLSLFWLWQVPVSPNRAIDSHTRRFDR